MNHARNVVATKRIGVLLLIMALSASTLVVQQAGAQVPVYKIEGVVYGPDFKPLQGATVSVLNAAGASAGTATTDAAGKFSVGNLQSGTYNVSATHACCDKDAVPVDVSGTDPVVQQNFRLRSPQGDQGGVAYTLKGIVKDAKSGQGIAGVLVEVWNYYQDASDAPDGRYYIQPSGGQQYFSTTSAADGSYSFSLRAGSVNLAARGDGYDHLHANFEMRETRTLDLPMKAAAGERALIQGTVKDADGKPIQDAYVNVQPDYRCKGDVCTATSYPSESSQEGDVSFYYEPRYGQYNGTTTGPDGKYSLRVAPGELLVSADAQNFVREEEGVTAAGGETKTVDLVMEKVPADSVKVSGVVRDADTGKPVPYAQVNLENQQWGHYNYTMTDKDGKYEFWTKPGYTIATASAYRYYYAPCVAGAEDSSSSEPSGTVASSGGVAKPMPPCDGSGERDQEYFPRAVTFVGAAGEPQALDVDLEPRPAPSSTFKGYVVNQTSQKGVAGVAVSFYNERTHDYGSAVTDEYGSYQIKIHGGYYTVRAYAAGFFDAVVNAEIGDKDEARLDLFLTPGERKYGGGCCWAYAESGKGGAPYATTAASSGPRSTAPPAAMASGGGDGASTDASAEGGQQSYLGSGGGLGPYKPASQDPGGSSPAPGILVLALVALGVAWARRRSEG
ncbi:MAG TPA: carboxypeptidase regulatory-like domain-containing protein [Candidatus Thermoplasmatota archaeon]|nr:carboxypeptidase regulatory-like domain-containing protein [Candidatus Thermoplasmatota archaeon]